MLLYTITYFAPTTGQRMARFDRDVPLASGEVDDAIARAECSNGERVVLYREPRGRWSESVPEVVRRAQAREDAAAAQAHRGPEPIRIEPVKMPGKISLV